jgi:hypothetical protein
MSIFTEMATKAGIYRAPEPENVVSGEGRPNSVFSDMFDSIFRKNTPAPATYPRTRGGARDTTRVTSSYEDYGKKLFAKEGGMRYDLFTGETTPSQPLDRLTIGQLKELQKKRKNSAAGAYQFTLSTVEELQKEMGLKDSDMFSAANQYRMFETFTKGNEAKAIRELGLNRVNDAERYSMHFLGRSGGVSFLRKLRETPNATFAKEFPSAYARNKAMFSKVGGANATIADAFSELRKRMK